MKHFIFVGLLVLIFNSIDVQAGDKYVRKSASGSGTSWSDAYGDLNNVSWTGMSGYTLWIAAGNYTGQLTTISTPNVTIKRATVSSHGSNTGWSDSYDGQVTVDPSGNFLIIDTGADGITLDGASHNPWKFRVVGVSGYNGMLQNYGADNVTVRNIEFDGNREDPPETNGPEDGLRWYGGSNTIVEHCYIHDYAQSPTGDEHMDGVQAPSATNITFRYNIFANNGMHLFLGDCEWENQYVNGINIHHNLFYNTANSGYASYNTIVLKGTNQGGSYPTIIENNTFAVRSSEFPLPDYRNAIGLSTSCNNLTGAYVRNNIFYYSTPGAVDGYFSHSYNAYYGVTAPTETGRVTRDPLFTSYSNNIYTLQSGSPARDSGTNLGYVEDIIGTAVPQNGSPDMGAYEFSQSGGGSLAPPTNLRIIK